MNRLNFALMINCTQIILIAEDDQDDQELLTYAFEKAAPYLKLCMVSDGKAAVDFLEKTADENLPCLILLDYNMPELNGAQVVQRLMPYDRFKNIPKVILSTSGNQDFIDECMNKGADNYLVKPYDIGGLINIAKELAGYCKPAA